MPKQSAAIPRPLPPRDECLQGGKHVIRGTFEGGEVLCCYDAERQSAATYHVEQQLWRIQVPVPLHEYLQALVLNGYDLPGGEDFSTWIAAVTGKPFLAWLEEAYPHAPAN